jgi:hypothetical protein
MQLRVFSFICCFYCLFLKFHKTTWKWCDVDEVYWTPRHVRIVVFDEALHFVWSHWISRCLLYESAHKLIFLVVLFVTESRDSSVGIATGYGLDDRGFGVGVPVWTRIFTPPFRPDWLWSPSSLLSNRHRGPFPWGVKWPLTSNKPQGQENMGVYIHSPIRLHGVVLN